MSDSRNSAGWHPPISRRRFVTGAGAAAAAATTGLVGGPTLADELPRVDERGPMAKALNYVHDAGTVDSAKRFSGHYCYNCVLFAGGDKEDWAGCSIFPGKAVNRNGWCSAWAPKSD